MHVYFSGIGGAGLSSLALIAIQAGYDVSGSDKQDSGTIDSLRDKGLSNIHIGQTEESIKAIHENNPIDWVVFSSAIEKENPNHPELVFTKEACIHSTKRDEFINKLLEDTDQKMIAIAGTHGKTTTTAMTVWMFKKLQIPVSYLLAAKTSFAEMAEFNPQAEYFVYEADEYDRNFLSFAPAYSIITGIAYDHPDIYPTKEEYYRAFNDFVCVSNEVSGHPEDLMKIGFPAEPGAVLGDSITLLGEVNRANALLVVEFAHTLLGEPVDRLTEIMNHFPGVSRRFEKIADNIYSDYAHTPEKIRGAIQMASEYLSSRVLDTDGAQEDIENRSESYGQYDERDSEVLPQRSAVVHESGVVIVYEGLHNTRQHFIKDQLPDLFEGTKKLYVVPSYLAREDESQEMLTPEKLCQITQKPDEREPSELNDGLKTAITKHAESGDLVLCLTAGGGGSLDEWLRAEFGQ